MEPDRAAQQEPCADRPEQSPLGDLQAAEARRSAAHDGAMHGYAALAQRLAVAPALLQAAAGPAEQPLPGGLADASQSSVITRLRSTHSVR